MCRSLPIERTTTSPEFSPTRILREHALGPSHGLGGLLDRVLHLERRVACAHRVVFVCQRRAEEGHDAVAHDLVHGALVAMDRLHHVLEHGIQELTGLLVIAFLWSFFKQLVEYDFTADLEEKLDRISNHEIDWKQVLRDFWRNFS